MSGLFNPVAGDQWYVAVIEDEAERFTLVPAQTNVSFDTVNVGTCKTVTVTVSFAEQFSEVFAVTMYLVVLTGEATGFFVLALDSPDEGDQLKVLPF
jgi:hypothetical protein